MNILHIVAGLTPGGGLSESIPLLALHQLKSENSNTVAIALLRSELSETAQQAEHAGIRMIRYAPSAPHCLYFSWSMLVQLAREIRQADIVNIHSHWTFPVWWGACLAMRYKKKVIMMPRGCFDPVRLAHSAWKKKTVGWLDRWFLRYADAIVVTSQAEKKWVEDFVKNGYKTYTCPPCYVIPNGVDMPDAGAGHKVASTTQFQTRIVLSLGRLHPLKGLDLLVEAWLKSSKVLKCESSEMQETVTANGTSQTNKDNFRTSELQNSRTFPWMLVIAGPDEQHTKEYVCARMDTLGLRFQNVEKVADLDAYIRARDADVIFLDAVHGEDKWTLLRDADVFVLPSRSENFGIVVGEALACEVPVVMTDVGPWKEESTMQHVLDEKYCEPWSQNGAIRFVETNADSIATGLTDMMRLSDEERGVRGVRGREWVRARFAWEAAARQMLEVYDLLRPHSGRNSEGKTSAVRRAQGAAQWRRRI